MVDVIGYSCTGCEACGDCCPVNAIEYICDAEGIWYPHIDNKKCIHCEQCSKCCPVISKEENNNREPSVFSVWSKQDEVRINSTSGGLFYELAYAFMKNDGYVSGCIYSEDYKSAKHILTNDVNMLSRIMGSKYFQSDMKGIYREISECLRKGNKVLFCGAPCQAAALKKYIGVNASRLFCVDFICRGINSPLAYKLFLEELERRYRSKVKNVHFKDKARGWLNLSTRVVFENGKIYLKDKYDDSWVNGFVVGNLFIRRSCTECVFKGLPRVSDMSIGDFWGLEVSKNDLKKGVSLLMVNNSKGDELFELVKERVVYRKESLEDAIKGNECILCSAPYNGERHLFWQQIEQGKEFSKSVWKCIHLENPRRQLHIFKIRLKLMMENWRK